MRKRKAGRPKKSPLSVRSERIVVLLTPGEAQLAARVAGDESISGWMRDLALRAIGTAPSEVPPAR